jgi:hypothetical protein
MSIVDAISTVAPPVREALTRAEMQGTITPNDVAYVVPSIGRLGPPAVAGSLVSFNDEASLTIQTFLKKEGDVFYATGTQLSFAVNRDTRIERGLLGVPISLSDIQRDEIVVIETRDGVVATRVTALHVKRP